MEVSPIERLFKGMARFKGGFIFMDKDEENGP
jgi:hypothetical protein